MLQKLFQLFSSSIDPAVVREKYHIPSTIKLNIRLTNDGFLVATSPDLPGLITEARNGKELLDMVNDAVLTYFDVPQKEADIVFDTVNIDGYGTVSYQHELQTASV